MTTTTDPITAWRAGWTDLARSTGWTDLARSWLDSWDTAWCGPRRAHECRHEGHHGRCCADDDHLRCCVREADVVVRARVGERRVLPLRLHNRWRRERPTTVEVGPWHACHGAEVSVQAAVEPSSLTLAPCRSAVVRITLDLGGQAGDEGRQHDVDRCGSSYSDVRFEGCARPLRLAVIVCADACAPVDVECDCGCCA
ncbi:MAG TPA: hypothetical protein VI248_16485 [Kineosporiaceae bacterium]